MELAAIQVVIGAAGSRQLYPDFNKLEVVKSSRIDWAYYVDRNGLGWVYDKCCDHSTEVAGRSPFGEQLGVLVVEDVFATQAVQQFPGAVTRLTEAELEDFWDNHAMARQPENTVNDSVVNGIRARLEAGNAPTDAEKRALDPDNAAVGINKNMQKRWTDVRTSRQITIKS